METVQFLTPQGELFSEAPVVTEEILLKGYQVMLLTRYVDEKMITLQRQGVISFALSSLGEEACAVASAAALELGDWLYPQYREAGAIFYRGMAVEDYIHHMFGNVLDPSKGRQMPNHFGSRKLNVVTVSSPIGTKIPHAAGCAYAMKLQKEPYVACVYFGEGASSEGDFHSGVNFAAVRRAPAIFFCRNNGYAISTKTTSQFRSDGVAPKAIGYGISFFRVDGNDFFAVYDAVKKAKEICLKGEGPVLIEAMTYRLGAHSTSDDPTIYRSREEEKKWKANDPVLRLKKYLIAQGKWDEKKESALKKKIEEEVTAAIEVAKKTAKPPLRSIIEDVYLEVPTTLEEQFQELKTFYPEV